MDPEVRIFGSHVLHYETKVDSLIESANYVHMQPCHQWFEARVE